MAATFRGNDRAILKKLKFVVGAVVARDARAADGTPTKKLSTRFRMFPVGKAIDTPPTNMEELLTTFASWVDSQIAETV